MTDQTSIPPSAFRSPDAGKFKPKLVREERYSILALAKMGVKREVIASAFGVDRRTVSHICNDSSTHYKDIRDHYRKMGHDEFVAAYIDENVTKRIAMAVDSLPGGDVPEPVSSRSNGYAGLHTIPPEPGLRSRSYKVEIRHLRKGGAENAVSDGWHYRVIDAATTYGWLNNGAESMKSSRACLVAVKENLTDD